MPIDIRPSLGIVFRATEQVFFNGANVSLEIPDAYRTGGDILPPRTPTRKPVVGYQMTVGRVDFGE